MSAASPESVSDPCPNPIALRPSLPHAAAIDQERLRSCAWTIGERRAADHFTPTVNHAGLAMVSPRRGFVHWRIGEHWVANIARARGDAWRHCSLVLRLYDVTYIDFNGLNAHRIQDHHLPGLVGHYFFELLSAGTWQLAEVGFRLCNGEFIPAARSQAAAFPPEEASAHSGHAALLVDEDLAGEEIGNLWEQERTLHERQVPKLRSGLRIAALACTPVPSEEGDALARYIAQLAAAQVRAGHEVQLFVPASERLSRPTIVDGVQYEPVEMAVGRSPLARARAFGRAIETRLAEKPEFDLLHVHEWMAGQGSWICSRPTVASLTSIENVRRGAVAVDEMSELIELAEREVAELAHCVLVPEWLRHDLIARYGLEPEKVRPFAMEGRPPDEWEAPIDFGQVKGEIHVGPLDRLLLYIGPLEHAAGPDLLIEALPVLLHRAPNLRVALVGEGGFRGRLEHLVQQHGLGPVVRFLGHVEGPMVTRLLRSSEALVLPSRYRVPMDDAVVDLARRAGRPVVTTHGGPAHLVRHEETGIVTYDNPGSIVWAADRILGDPSHAESMGRNGKYSQGHAINWQEVAGQFFELCCEFFPELTIRPGKKTRRHRV